MATERWGDLDVVSPLVGRHQAANTALAIEVLAHAPETLRPTRETLLEGIRRVRHRGRDELHVLEGRTWLLDVAHNEAGVASLADTLDVLTLPRPIVALIGVLGDKDWRAMLPPLLARADAAVLTVPPTAPAERRWDPTVAALGLADDAEGEIVVEEDFDRALALAQRMAGAGTVVVTGSIHTVGSAMRAIGIRTLP
jgi:dihydrofolate synthase/folylpolyglutamate synthase